MEREYRSLLELVLHISPLQGIGDVQWYGGDCERVSSAHAGVEMSIERRAHSAGEHCTKETGCGTGARSYWR